MDSLLSRPSNNLIDRPPTGPFAEAQQIQDNFNRDTLSKFRGTLLRARRRAMLSKDPRQIMAYFQMADAIGIDPSFSAIGRGDERMARAQNKYFQEAQAAKLFQPAQPLDWLNSLTPTI
jgi:hypothetical protein